MQSDTFTKDMVQDPTGDRHQVPAVTIKMTDKPPPPASPEPRGYLTEGVPQIQKRMCIPEMAGDIAEEPDKQEGIVLRLQRSWYRTGVNIYTIPRTKER